MFGIRALFCDWLLSCAVAATPTTPVPDLHYGTVLYAYYQDDTSQALLETLVAQKRGLLGDEPVRLDLAKGSFAFAEGMYRLADETFAAIDPKELQPIDRMRLSFHLAREHFRREEWVDAERLIGDVDLGTTWLGRERVHPEVEFMRAELAARRGDFVAARSAIDRIHEKSPHRAYALFNLGVAERASGDVVGAAATFRDLTQLDAYSEEVLDLQQRALVALSIVKRTQNATARAEDILGDLPSGSRYRDLALTSYGGLAMDAGNYELAARVWLTLSEGDYWTQSSAAARLALPMSLEQMASRQQALVQYRVTEARYEERLDKLHGLMARADEPKWVGGLLEVFARPEADAEELEAERRRALIDEWRTTFGHTDWLDWLAGENVHELLLEWRELKDIAGWLEALPEELETFDGLAKEQRRRSREADALTESDGFTARREGIVKALESSREDLNELRGATPERSRAWMIALSDPAQAKLLADLAAKRALIEHGLEGAERERYLARIDRLEGVVFWDLVDAAPARIRELENAAREADGLLADVDVSLMRIATAEGEYAAGVETDFLSFQSRADDITRQVAVAIADRETRLVDQIRGGIHQEVAQLERHLLLTRMAIARATDQLALSADSRRTP